MSDDIDWYNRNKITDASDVLNKGGMYGHVKVPIPIIQSKEIKVNSICCYPVKCTNGIMYYAGERRGEKNHMHAQLIKTKWGSEINLKIAGGYHYERVSYNKKPFDQWNTWLELNFPIDEIDNLINFLMEVKENGKSKDNKNQAGGNNHMPTLQQFDSNQTERGNNNQISES